MVGLASDWSRIAAAAPINRTAAVVTSGSRERSDRPLPPKDRWLSHAPPPTIPERYWPARHSGFEDLCGRKLGRLTVVGYLGKQNPKKKARWLVRCTCGDYEVRSAAAIKAGHDQDDCCWGCHRVQRMREAQRIGG